MSRLTSFLLGTKSLHDHDDDICNCYELPLVFLQHSLTMFATDTIHATPLSRHKSPQLCSFVANGASSCDSPKPIAEPLTQNTNLPAPTPYQISSYNSLEIDESDPEEWFEQANKHPTATLSIDSDPPFFQAELDSSNEIGVSQYQYSAVSQSLIFESSTTSDYLDIIDDLAAQTQKLKKELKQFRQQSQDMLQWDICFEVKICGLGNEKRAELKMMLQDVIESLGSPLDTYLLTQNGPRMCLGLHLQAVDSGQMHLGAGTCESGVDSDRVAH
jgi:hypothetical protein